MHSEAVKVASRKGCRAGRRTRQVLSSPSDVVDVWGETPKPLALGHPVEDFSLLACAFSPGEDAEPTIVISCTKAEHVEDHSPHP